MSNLPKMSLVKIELRFHPNEKSFPCNMDYTLSNETPIYYNYDEPYKYYGKKYYSVTYFLFYRENLAIGLNGIFPYNKSLGYHDKDREVIKILYDTCTLRPEYVFFSAHAQEGQFYKYSDCNFTEDKSLIVYSSLNSHAFRRSPKIYWRVFGFANDICSNKGKWIRPTYIECNINYNAQNREVFDTPWISFFMPFYQSKIKVMKEKQREEEEEFNRQRYKFYLD